MDLRYLRGTSKLCLCFGGSKLVLEGFTNVDFSSNLDRRLSTFRYFFTFAVGAIPWQFKSQKSTTLFTTKAKYITANEEGKEMLW